jgi:hypothetical protein
MTRFASRADSTISPICARLNAAGAMKTQPRMNKTRRDATTLDTTDAPF